MAVGRCVAFVAAAATLAPFWHCSGLSFLEQARPSVPRRQRQAIWIQGFPRSGSSTILSMIAAGSDVDDDANSRLFSLFEPCHPGDEVELESGEHVLPWGAFPNVGSVATGIAASPARREEYGCPAMLWGLTACDFGKVVNLWGWSNRHSSSHNNTYTPAVAAGLCERADMLVFKTVGKGKTTDPSRILSNALWLLRDRPELHVFEVVRDPRAIFASWKNTDPFPRILKERSEGGSPPIWKEACETFSANLDVPHERVHRIVFEDFVRDPEATMRTVYTALGWSIGEAQRRWLNSTFNVDGCGQSQWGNFNYSDCQIDPSSSLDKWRKELSQAELDEISAYEPCRNVFKAYNYSLT